MCILLSDNQAWQVINYLLTALKAFHKFDTNPALLCILFCLGQIKKCNCISMWCAKMTAFMNANLTGLFTKSALEMELLTYKTTPECCDLGCD